MWNVQWLANTDHLESDEKKHRSVLDILKRQEEKKYNKHVSFS